ncbi:MAG: fructosamine kinase family protein [Verrucomicrobia bacterium]|nr:fructosamine kinase family protein [Cytophagales bacterium]
MNFNDLHEEQTQFFESILFESLGSDTVVEEYQVISGGNVSNAVRLETNEGFFFVKWNESQSEDYFVTEAKGLQLLHEIADVKTPEIFGFGHKYNKSYIILEFLTTTTPEEKFWENLGIATAHLHQHTAPKFGLKDDNYIGSLRQNNAFEDSWIDFFIQKRLLPQAGLAYYNGEISLPMLHRLEKLASQLPAYLPPAKPALLHGNLITGNVLTGVNQDAIFIDPAVYYGCYEAEIAFTKLFGGFEAVFYETYQAINPMESGFEDRVGIYNLYPLLIHINLFGSGYLSGVEKVLRRFGL